MPWIQKVIISNASKTFAVTRQGLELACKASPVAMPSGGYVGPVKVLQVKFTILHTWSTIKSQSLICNNDVA